MDKQMNELIQKYVDIIIPTNFIQTFKTDNEFIEWANQGSVEDLDCTIKEFEEYELYEYCSILKQIRDDKVSQLKLTSSFLKKFYIKR